MKNSFYKLQDFIGGVVLNSVLSDYLLEKVIKEKDAIIKTVGSRNFCRCCCDDLAAAVLLDLLYGRQTSLETRTESFTLRPSFDVLDKFFQTFQDFNDLPGLYLINEDTEKLPNSAVIWLKKYFVSAFQGDLGVKRSRDWLEGTTENLRKYSRFLDQEEVTIYDQKLELMKRLCRERESTELNVRRKEAVSKGNFSVAHKIAVEQGRSLTVEELGVIADLLAVADNK